MSPEDKKISQEGSLPRMASRLGQTIVFDGNLSGHEALEIQGNFSGQVDLALHDLTIQKTSRVKADIRAKNLFLYGQLEGKVRAERVVISDTGRFTGDIIACKISVQNGAKFKGTIKISQEYKP
ncbi:MAG: polymer-forming cytoskeletal protein [Candidatus Saccharicenans sp.]|jgi:cytoskeletal protein CcmA (bactofilin family)|nr:polymer-forming cytoskeletal protein [Candidatus Saccharicenans sp.]MDH7493886.1 polymer-forming cytoskeletal protein [Candidatus Saccharicenans sp.]